MLINSGIARSYIIKEDGKDFTWHFHFSNENSANLKNFFIVDYASFTHQEPSKMNFEALEDCEVIIIDYQVLEKLYNSDIKWQFLGRIIAQEAYYLTHHRTISLLTLTSQERLDDLVNEYPNIFEQVPHYHIASFLGISPQHLSRLRKS
jgi:CRP-like cAMP-binding protein